MDSLADGIGSAIAGAISNGLGNIVTKGNITGGLSNSILGSSTTPSLYGTE
ncbi:hypothetical protein [Tropheryma whipplei]|uniref:hypothetical protein n=1 Tax=Tropheryma whipplei TaxID=2039 RepID=UPI0012BA91A3|nr:hypothetical protein [Tropheryma whipplei]